MKPPSKFRKSEREGKFDSSPNRIPIAPHSSRPFRITRKSSVVSDAAAVRNARSQKLSDMLAVLPAVVDAAFAEALAELMVDHKKKVRGFFFF